MLTSRIAQLCVIDVLSVALAVTLGEGCLELFKKTSEAVKKKRYLKYSEASYRRSIAVRSCASARNSTIRNSIAPGCDKDLQHSPILKLITTPSRALRRLSP